MEQRPSTNSSDKLLNKKMVRGKNVDILNITTPVAQSKPNNSSSNHKEVNDNSNKECGLNFLSPSGQRPRRLLDFKNQRFPFVDWSWFLALETYQIYLKEKTLDENQQDETRDYDTFYVSTEAKTLYQAKFFIICSLVMTVIGSTATFSWSRVLVFDNMSPNQFFVLNLFFLALFFLSNLLLVKYSCYPVERGLLVFQMAIAFIISAFTIMSGGLASPVLISLYTLIPLFCSCFGIKSAVFFGVYVFHFVSLLTMFSDCNFSLVNTDSVRFVNYFENLIALLMLGLAVYISHVDITRERKILQMSINHAVNADKTKSFFLASTSHEMRTPLHHVSLTNQLLTKTLMDSLESEDNDPLEKKETYQKLFQLVDQSKGATNLLLALIDDALDLSKIQSGGLTVDKEIIQLPACVEEVFNMFEEKANSKHITFTCAMDEISKDKHVEADRMRVIQILTNFLGNAFKFTDNWGSIHLALSLKKLKRTVGHANDAVLVINHFIEKDELDHAELYSTDLLCLSVEDSGIGIPKHAIKSIFAPFTQANGACTTRKYGGSGLGLAINEMLAKLMNASITVESKEGSGSIFSLWFQIKEVSSNFSAPYSPLISATLEFDKDRFTFSQSEPDEDLENEEDDSVNEKEKEQEVNNKEGNEFIQSRYSLRQSVRTPQKLSSYSPPLKNLSLQTPPRKKSLRTSTLQNEAKKKKKKKIKTKKNPSQEKALIGFHIMICDDNVVSVKLLSTLLTSLGAQVDTFISGADLYKGFKTFCTEKSVEHNNKNFSLPFVLLDLYMPDIDGFETAKLMRTFEDQFFEMQNENETDEQQQLKQDHSLSDRSYIIALSATSRAADVERALGECKFNHFMTKPFDTKTLTETLVHLNQKRADRS